MGDLHAAKPFVIHSNRRGAFLCRDLRTCSAGEDDKPVLQQRVQKLRPSFSWGIYQHCIINCGRTFQARSERQMFSSYIIIWGDYYSALFLLGQLLNCFIASEWEKDSSIEACETEFQSFVNDQPQLECHVSRTHSDISNILSYLTHQSGFCSRLHLYRVSLVGHQVDFFAVIRK